MIWTTGLLHLLLEFNVQFLHNRLSPYLYMQIGLLHVRRATV